MGLIGMHITGYLLNFAAIGELVSYRFTPFVRKELVIKMKKPILKKLIYLFIIISVLVFLFIMFVQYSPFTIWEWIPSNLHKYLLKPSSIYLYLIAYIYIILSFTFVSIMINYSSFASKMSITRKEAIKRVVKYIIKSNKYKLIIAFFTIISFLYVFNLEDFFYNIGFIIAGNNENGTIDKSVLWSAISTVTAVGLGAIALFQSYKADKVNKKIMEQDLLINFHTDISIDKCEINEKMDYNNLPALDFNSYREKTSEFKEPLCIILVLNSLTNIPPNWYNFQYIALCSEDKISNRDNFLELVWSNKFNYDNFYKIHRIDDKFYLQYELPIDEENKLLLIDRLKKETINCHYELFLKNSFNLQISIEGTITLQYEKTVKTLHSFEIKGQTEKIINHFRDNKN